MKKNILLIISIALLLSGCASEDITMPSNDSVPTKRSPEEAVTIAQSIAERLQGTDNQSRSIRSTAKVSVIGSGNLSRAAQDTLIYAVDFEDNKGYVLVSAAYSGDAVIGYTDSGSFDAKRIAQNPAYSCYLNQAQDYVSYNLTLPGNGNIGQFPITKPNDGLPEPITKTINPMLWVSWGQAYPEGIYCPNGIAGCAQTAMAQMMSYLQTTTSLNLTYPERTENTLTLDWSAIQLHQVSSKTSAEYNLHSCFTTAEAHNSLGKLCRELGYRNKASYGTSATGTNPKNVYTTFKNLVGTSKITNYYESIPSVNSLYDALTANGEPYGIIFLIGYDAVNGGHGWVCDGAKHTISYSQALKIDGTYEVLRHDDYAYHFNWGWCGVDNGYFSAGVFKNNTSDTAYNFNTNNCYFAVYK